MSWRKIPMKFPGVCIICNEKIAVNEIGLWAQGIGVKHEKCSQTKDLKCIVCDNSAGCQTCEFRDVCDIERVSQLCICKTCSEEKLPFESYQKSVQKKFIFLDIKP